MVNALNLGPRAPDLIFSPSHSQHSQSINKGSSVGITCIISNRRHHSQIVAAQSEALNKMSFSNSSRTKMSSEKIKIKIVAVVSGR